MKSGMKFEHQESEKEIHFSSLFKSGLLTTKSINSLNEDIVGNEEFVLVPFSDQGGYNQDYLIINQPIPEIHLEKSFNGFMFEIAISEDLVVAEEWAQLVVVVEAEDDPWLQLNTIDLLALPKRKWLPIEFYFPKRILGKKIKKVR